ncbi:MAG: hypothetical protein K5668_02005 [Lachnospiraceae bacterium]|nr:hypothetical protein [Lachnospiraceae bacterium]
MRITNKIMNNYSVYNINTNKALLDNLNTQMSTRKKINDPTEDPVTAIQALRYRGSLSEYTQYLGKNVTDAASWTDTTQTAIDTAKDIIRSLKAEYTSASNGSNESTDRWTYYNNMRNIVNEYFSVGDTTNENRYIFTGARTGDSLTFSDKDFADRAKEHGGIFLDDHRDTFMYKAITEYFELEDVESYSYTARTDNTGTSGFSGITDKEINELSSVVDETTVQNVEVFRLRLSYEDLDTTQAGILGDENRKSLTLHVKNGSTVTKYPVEMIRNDYEVNQDSFVGDRIYLNTTTGNLIFGSDMKAKVTEALSGNGEVYYCYDKFHFETGDVKPEHLFDCVDVALKTSITYNDYSQDIYYNVGENQQIKVNSNAEDVFTLDARRDLDELEDALTAMDEAQAKVDRLKEMQEDKLRYSTAEEQQKITDLLRAATKEAEYAKTKVDTMLSNGITKAGDYFDMVNLAGTAMGTSVNRLNLIRNRLTEHQATTTAQASDNENIDISTLAVEVNSATLSYNAALQVTGKISQQSLVNFL